MSTKQDEKQKDAPSQQSILDIMQEGFNKYIQIINAKEVLQSLVDPDSELVKDFKKRAIALSNIKGEK